MIGIFGTLNRQGGPLDPGRTRALCRGMQTWGRAEPRVLCDGPVAAGTVSGALSIDTERGVLFTAGGRVDNRAELAAALGIGHRDVSSGEDGELMRRAWDRWGEAAPAKIFGDWAFAVWDRAARKLFLARDHAGNTALYYHEGKEVFAFASSRRALLDLRLTPTELDELYLARVLVSWSPRGDSRTVHSNIKRLPPAHVLTVAGGRTESKSYWRLEETPELHLPQRSAYVEAFREAFDRAVSDRLGEGPIASMLSGGLDSGSVAASAAKFLGERGQRLAAFTSVPLFATANQGARFLDELPFASATANASGNIDLHPVNAAALSPVQAIRKMLAIALEPQHAAGNMFWMLELNRLAAAQGCRTLLTGQLGNGGVSWTGDYSSQSLGFQIRHRGIKRWLKESARRQLSSAPMVKIVMRRRWRASLQAGLRFSAIRPEFERRTNVIARWVEALGEQVSPTSPRARRSRIILQGLGGLGAIYAEMGAAAGIAIRDPTADARLLAFSFSVPDRYFMETETGLDRWLIREAMKGRLPDEVRLNPRRGLQAGDLVRRLRACAGEVENALSEIARGPGADYLDIPRMRLAWDKVRAEDTADSFGLAATVLTRGIMAGLFVDGFGKTW